MATKVKLREKPISRGRKSLYLDFYPPIPNPKTGQATRREFLGLYVFAKPKAAVDKLHNQETQKIADSKRQHRENELNKPEIYSVYEREQLKIREMGEKDFVEYFESLADKRKASNHDNWVSALRYLKTFTNGNLKFADMNEKFCIDFREFLLNTKSNKSHKAKLSQNSAVSYFNKVKAALKQAYKEGYLQNDLNAKVSAIKQAETQRNFLSLEELNILAKTECANPLLKQAALFSALTGLRFSDIQKLIWSELEHLENNGYFIRFQQQKTKGMETLPISKQAYELLGERGNGSDQVFAGLTYSAYENKHLAKWIGLAGIEKDITFHCFRHTFATLQLSLGTDIYTVSKMLGHRDLKTTQVYAQIVNATKREAADKIILDLTQ